MSSNPTAMFCVVLLAGCFGTSSAGWNQKDGATDKYCSADMRTSGKVKAESAADCQAKAEAGCTKCTNLKTDVAAGDVKYYGYASGSRWGDKNCKLWKECSVLTTDGSANGELSVYKKDSESWPSRLFDMQSPETTSKDLLSPAVLGAVAAAGVFCAMVVAAWRSGRRPAAPASSGVDLIDEEEHLTVE